MKPRRRVITCLAVAALIAAPAVNAPAGAQQPPMPGDAPHYFTMPNYANSPLRLADALVEFVGGGGSGAAATVSVDPATGAITQIDVSNPGSGYTSAPQVIISAAMVTPTTPAEAIATVDYSGVVTAITVDQPGGGYTAPVVDLVGGGGSGAAAHATGGVDAFTVTNGGNGYLDPVVGFSLPDDPNGTTATASATIDATGVITAIDVVEPGTGYTSAPIVTIRDGADPSNPGPGSGATATATMAISGFVVDDFGAGYTSVPQVDITDPGGIGAGAAGTAAITTAGGSVTGVTVTAGGAGYVTPGLEKFVDSLPGLGPDNANNLGQYIPVAVADTATYPGSDYYEIAVVEYQEQMHSDLAPTTLRGYVQLATSVVPGNQVDLGNGYLGVDRPHYLGPTIVAMKDRPVRILFRNLLPTGTDGNLFLPVDTTVMGAGMGPLMVEPGSNPPRMMDEPDPQNPMSGMIPKPEGSYTENRATLHLHGGITPWISDGTAHQWITPAGETTSYPEGVSVQNVPDMPDPGPGAMTFYYTNQQSARLMFYHDHSFGITRLNVYAGEAAAYVITDQTEQSLIAGGVIPGPDQTVPLVIQDKTFVPADWQLADTDPLWDTSRWGGEGNLWLPHVYSPAQNPGDASGVNQYGRWAYGPWFWPPTNSIEHGPMPNPYFGEPGEPPLMPGVPYLSMGMESFQDTPVVNGTAYPTFEVDPQSYRFRILNAANDRFWNLSLYEADASGSDVALNPAEVEAALTDPAGVFPTPVAGTEGPDWVQIGTEGGFLPSPTVIPAHPITWVTDPTVFNAGNVDQHSLLLGPAERADVVVDFSQFAGQTLILYNDAPAAFPARDPRYDYYTGNADMTETGGAPSTLPGYGPNTRTVMQIKVNAAPVAPAFDQAALMAAFAHNAAGSGVFESSQKPMIVGQSAYNAAYGTSFPENGPRAGLVQIYDTSLTFDTLSGNTLTMSLRGKMIQDEMGEAFEREYGRMSGFLGVETPNPQAGLQNMILYPFLSPPTEVIDGLELPPGVDVEPIGTVDDGTQIWKFTHNGVDTHPIHFHLYDVQLLNRVGWDGIIRRPDPNELGWKDTVRVSPLEDTIVALRPIVPTVPFDVPNSIRLLDPTMPEGAMIEDTTAAEAAGLPLMAFNPDGEPIDIVNHYVNFGWEYVVHCHILSHEEMDMMRSVVVGVAPKAPTGLTWTTTGSGNNRRNVLTWTDQSTNDTAFVIERSRSAAGPWTTLATVPSDRAVVGPGTGPRTYTDLIRNTGTWFYQVYAINTVGDTWDYSNPALNEIPPGEGFPRLTLDSRGQATSTVAAPSGLTATAVRKNGRTATATVNWVDNANNESGFLVQRADNAGFSLNVVNATVGANLTTFNQSVARGVTYYYRVQAFNDTGSSDWSNTASVTTP